MWLPGDRRSWHHHVAVAPLTELLGTYAASGLEGPLNAYGVA